MKKPLILVVDDDEEILDDLKDKLVKWGFDCISTRDGTEALLAINDNQVNLIISDQQMPNMGGLELLSKLKSRKIELPFIMLTAFGSINNAITSLKHGANDYLEKPYNHDNLRVTIERSLDITSLRTENKRLKSRLRDEHSFVGIATHSKSMKDAVDLAKKVAASQDTTVLLLGESGTGKEVLAKAIHYAGETVGSNYVAINCAGIPSNLLESELFGHTKGAFTGAEKERVGKLEIVGNGTLLLDEIGDMPYDLQAKLLRVLQEMTFEKVGSNKIIKADFRVIVATNRDLKELVRQNKFREDLYHRINFFPIKIPPLRERREDILHLANHFLDQYNADFGKNIEGISNASTKLLLDHSWPGNVRELKNCIGRAVLLCDAIEILPSHLPLEEHTKLNASALEHFDITIPKSEVSLNNIVDEILRIALRKCGHNQTKAAEFLKINRKTFSRRIQ
jgi:DNA-binding NtrC family response regulator